MGRSKFPGKPSKHVNRKRVNVLPPTSDGILECNRSMTAAETDGENKQAGNENGNRNNESAPLTSTLNTKVSLRRRLSRKLQSTTKTLLNATNTSKRALMSKICNKTNIKKSKINNPSSRKSIHSYTNMKNIKQCRSNSGSGILSKESNNLVGKFVLPSRSVHSSRVIKPNKRFINVDLSDTLTLKKKVIAKRHCIKQAADAEAPPESSLDNRNDVGNVQVPHHPVVTSTITATATTKTAFSNGGRIVLRQARLKLHTTQHSASSLGMVEGPFSSCVSGTGVSPPGTVTCGVCGAVRFYRFVKQARKFNIYSCESCRKFISKMIKRRQQQQCSSGNKTTVVATMGTASNNINVLSNNNNNNNNNENNNINSTLVCHKGQGMCHVPPIVRSQQMKLIRCAYKARCPACWLKMCLRSFQMPMSLKHSLVQLLPKNMQGSDVVFNNSLPSLPLLWQAGGTNAPKNIDSIIIGKERESHKQADEIIVKRRPVRFRNKSDVANNHITPTTTNSDIKRQKIDLKGPRVKHVCRSASIVLGQPLATFPGDNNIVDRKTVNNVNINNNIETKDSSVVVSQGVTSIESKKVEITSNDNVELLKESVSSKNSKCESSTASENESSDSCDKLPKLPLTASEGLLIKRDKNTRSQYLHVLPEASKVPGEKRPKPSELQNSIQIDYWENYDFDDISQNGFCLIASQRFPMPAICFLCGSAGRESLLHCSLCCEPYHPFCLEQSPPVTNNNNRQFVWLCPRCTTCSACKGSDRQKIYCQKCSKAYHPECFSAFELSNDGGPVICTDCLACKNCGRENSTSFVGNIPLCSECFMMKKKGSMCPICRESYDNIDTGEKVMECDQCKKWIHANCEGLSEECYQILSILPESIRYSCCLCSKESPPYWRKVVESELKFNFHQVLRLLSKNKLARSVLKLSPLNNRSVTRNKAVTQVKRIQFSDDDDNTMGCEDNNDFSETTNENNGYTIDSGTLSSHLNQNNQSENGQGSDLVRIGVTNNKTLSMLDIKNKLNSNEYSTISDFNREMEEALANTNSDELLNIYHVILRSVFPWYKPSTWFGNNKSDLDMTLKIQSPSITNHSQDILCAQSECVTIDMRSCSFCKSIGDGLSHLESRLLYCGQNEWVHVNCALWSSEVYEEIDGSLQNVHGALQRGRLLRCTYCKQKGAAIGCCFKNCCETYHFICARTAKCHFMYDKTMYCFGHELPKESSVIVSPSDFDIRRSVFVEVSDCSKKGRFSQIDKVNVMVGSLCVTDLGKINPLVSDNFDAIIPAGYVCSRLFWSTIEPWKLVSYKISTSIINAHVNALYVDKNFTVDHNLPKSVVERRFKEIISWQRDQDRVDFDDEEEPQTGADLLSPELTDAIFEELPHELLDGISVQDIFPKLMSYEDFISADCKSDIGHFDNNLSNDVPKKSDTDIENLTEFDVASDKESRNKSDSDITDKDRDNKNSQRSCSLRLSCKLDDSFSPTVKKRKITPRENNVFFQLLQVDGNFDDSSSSECGSPTEMKHENIWDNMNLSEEPVTCERCHSTYRTQASYTRHLDACDVICSSESDSEVNSEQESGIEMVALNSQPNMMENSQQVVMNVSETSQPVVLTSYESYQNEIHTSVLNTQTFMTSKSTAEVISVPQNNAEVIIPQMQNMQKAPMEQPAVSYNLLQPNHQPVNNDTFTVTQAPTISLNEPISIGNSQPAQFCLNQTVPLCVNQPITIQPNATISVNSTPSLMNTTNPMMNQSISINQSGAISINQPTTIQPSMDYHQPQTVTIQPIQYSNNITPMISVGSQNQLTFGDKLITTTPNILNSLVTQSINVSPQTSRWVKPVGKPTVFASKIQKCNNSNSNQKIRGRTIAAKRPLNHFEEGDTIIIPQQPTTSTPSVILQHLPSTSFIPSFVDTFQQQTGQNLQYVATLTPQYNPTVHSQPVVHLQATDNMISLLPNVQPTTMIIQQQPQQHRVLDNHPQLIMDSNGSLSWATAAPQPVQPVYYGFETIVQNTVMQSQQFLPTTMPGVLTANSSYSTTTQVFQTSKLEPVLDVAQNSYVLLNPGQLVQQSQQPTATIEIPQNTHQNHTVSAANNAVFTTNGNSTVVHNKEMMKSSPVNSKHHSVPFERNTVAARSSTVTSNQSTVTSSAPSTASITLPTAPFVPEQGIPTNVVTPTPKQPMMSTQQSRPMSRVLPMQTLKDTNKVKIQFSEKQEQAGTTPSCKTTQSSMNKLFVQPVRVYEKNLAPKKVVEKTKMTEVDNRLDKNETTVLFMNMDKTESIKMVFQNEEDPVVSTPTYKASDNVANEKCVVVDPPKTESIVVDIEKPKQVSTSHDDSPKITNVQQHILTASQENNSYKITSNIKQSSVQVAPLRPIKSNVTTPSPTAAAVFPVLTDKQNRQPEKTCTNNNNCSASTNTVKTGTKSETPAPPKHVHQEKKENENNAPSILYTIETQDGFKYSSTSVSDLWAKVFEAVQNARAAHNMPPLPPDSTNIMNSLQILGLKTPGLRYLIEQLPGAAKCTKYKPNFNFMSKYMETDEEPLGHSHGSSRCMPNVKRNDTHDQFGWLASIHRKPEHSLIYNDIIPRRGSVNNLPMAMRFRQLKISSKYSVGVFRSQIHRRGLFCLRDFEAGEMVIEYAGEVIRSVLTDKREKYYNSKGIGCYMFRIDDNLVVDATMTGNAARFINHSCDPNCYSKVVEILGHKHIIIFALRRIICGEELTYDYKFPIEEDKIPCTCGTRRCRKFLN